MSQNPAEANSSSASWPSLDGPRAAGEKAHPAESRDGVEGSVSVPHAGGVVPGSGDDPLAVRAERHATLRLQPVLETKAGDLFKVSTIGREQQSILDDRNRCDFFVRGADPNTSPVLELLCCHRIEWN